PFLPADLLELCRWTARYYLASLAEVIATIVPASVPRPAEERALRLVRRLSADEQAALARRAPARARAYHALAAAPGAELTVAAARAAGVGAAQLGALVAAGLAEPVVRARTAAAAPRAAPRPALTRATRALERVAAYPLRPCARRRRRALGGLRAGPATGPRGRGRGARRGLQAGGGAALQCARPGRGARPPRRRGGRARFRHPLGRE